MYLKNYFKIAALSAIIALFFTITGVSAQEASGTEEPVKIESPVVEPPKTVIGTPVNISGSLTLQWAKELTINDLAANQQKTSQFSIQCAQINLDKKFDDILSGRVSGDVDNAVTSNAASSKASKSSSYKFYLKFAWAQAKKQFGPVETALKAGLIDTAVISTVHSLSDISWIYNCYINKSSDLLINKTAIDTPQDLGASLSMNVMKMVTVMGLYGNGWGSKSTLVEDRSNDAAASDTGYKEYGSAYQGMVNVNPVQGVNILGFYRNQETNKEIDNNYISYYGAGAMYSNKLIKAGATYTFPEISTQASSGADAVKDKYGLFDSWATANLDSVVGLPVLLHGRFAMGRSANDQAKTDMGDYGNTTLYGLGLGYAYLNDARIIAYYVNKKYQKVDKADSDFMIKSEIKF